MIPLRKLTSLHSRGILPRDPVTDRDGRAIRNRATRAGGLA
jgi:hypothetical protein